MHDPATEFRCTKRASADCLQAQPMLGQHWSNWPSRTTCRPCRRALNAQYRQAHPQKFRAYYQKYNAARRQQQLASQTPEAAAARISRRVQRQIATAIKSLPLGELQRLYGSLAP